MHTRQVFRPLLVFVLATILMQTYYGVNARARSSIIQQNPQEMIWIETQAATFMIIFVFLLCLWPISEYYRHYMSVQRENLVRNGMDFLFALNDES